MRIRFFAGLTVLLGTLFSAQQVAAQLNLNIPPGWQRQQMGNQQIFQMPGRNEGVSVNPAPELARLGAPMNILDNVLDQYHRQFPDLQVGRTCAVSPTMALAFVRRRSENGELAERIMVGTGQGSATIIVFWAPAGAFAAEDAKLTGGQPSCP
jgi:hypothetical protein